MRALGDAVGVRAGPPEGPGYRLCGSAWPVLFLVANDLGGEWDVVCYLVRRSSPENYVQRFSWPGGGYGAGEGGRGQLPENTAEEETRHTDALRVWRADVRGHCAAEGGDP